ncbi:hypothetical protein LNTAR_21145 [Lentisphaera araneosa HTCC2155]|uniref:Uncharacterized protein n=1 Tax=Lentisphaera araneosa HTCC2155 TaxID=313628 RepID=A6DLW3_9BACT|nr:hypothetical protein LNTAR_21145 [Lentisphaera araneosa HTCC2155]
MSKNKVQFQVEFSALEFIDNFAYNSAISLTKSK